MIHFERPSLILLILLLLPSLTFFSFQAKKLFRSISFFKTKELEHRLQLKTKLILRSLCFSLAWISFVFALSGPSWGTKSFPMQKSGLALSFVFDISHSMEAIDEENKIFGINQVLQSRLSHAKDLARALLMYMRKDNKNPNVSLVITKGASFVSLPFSQDYSAFDSYVSQIYPYLMTAPGSHLGSGIRSAIASFPSNHARFASIILLTDGDDTKGDLEASISEALSYGINVIIVGFGSIKGTTVISGGRRQGQEVHTSLKEENLKEIVARLKLKYPLHSNSVHYFPSRDGNVLDKILPLVSPKLGVGEKMLTTYTIKPIKRHRDCILLSIIFFILGLLFSQVNFKQRSTLASYSIVLFFLPFLFSSCSFPIKDASHLLKGAYYASQDSYDKATYVFIQVLEEAENEGKTELAQYALYNLSNAYMKLNEDESAMERLKQIRVDAPKQILFARFYNQGLIAYENGEFMDAFEYFKEALLVQPHNLDAKINLELSLQQTSHAKPIGESLMSEFSETDELNDAQNSVFTLIRESEENRWKNSIESNGDEDVLDY